MAEDEDETFESFTLRCGKVFHGLYDTHILCIYCNCIFSIAARFVDHRRLGCKPLSNYNMPYVALDMPRNEIISAITNLRNLEDASSPYNSDDEINVQARDISNHENLGNIFFQVGLVFESKKKVFCITCIRCEVPFLNFPSFNNHITYHCGPNYDAAALEMLPIYAYKPSRKISMDRINSVLNFLKNDNWSETMKTKMMSDLHRRINANIAAHVRETREQHIREFKEQIDKRNREQFDRETKQQYINEKKPHFFNQKTIHFLKSSNDTGFPTCRNANCRGKLYDFTQPPIKYSEQDLFANLCDNNMTNCTICYKTYMLRCIDLWNKRTETFQKRAICHNERRYGCPKCMKTFTNKYLLKNHVKNRHMDKKSVRAFAYTAS